ncbi:MAG: hypothetical protein KC635_24045, partial [Myxococcales bacterium]|nr:hypothetical protein [Myxococcales bacterium]
MCRRARLAVFAPLALLSLLLVPACADDATTGGVDVADGILEPDTLVVDTSVPADTIVVIDTSADTAGPADTGGGSDVEGGFGAPCQGNVDCLDGFCVEGEEGFFCTKICEESCPDGMDCKSVLTAGADPVFLCLPRLAKVCVPCKSDFQCTGGACLEIDGAGQCAISCEGAGDCPTGYDCAADPAGVRSGDFCQPRSGSCDCTPELDGAQRTCVVANDVGTCYGVETCDAETGWGGCNARTPAEDLCDGLDNDCNGLVDDGVEDGGACNKTIAGVGTCHGVEVCLGPQGLVCSAPTPEAETCDFKDNDCDGGVDEDFKDASGEWTTTANCGTCGNDCSTKIPHGV